MMRPSRWSMRLSASVVLSGRSEVGRSGVELGQGQATDRKVRGKCPRHSEPDQTPVGTNWFHGVIGRVDSGHRPRPSAALDVLGDPEGERNAGQARHSSRGASCELPAVHLGSLYRRSPRRPLGRIGQQPPQHLWPSIDGPMDPQPPHPVTVAPPTRLATSPRTGR